MKDKQKYLDKLRDMEIFADSDQEVAHINADDILCDILMELGYEDIVEQYNRIPKWFA